MFMEPASLLRQINAIHETTFELGQRYPDGEQGAFALLDKQGNRYVLKWKPGALNTHRIEEAQAVTNLLRSIGYPAPRYVFTGYALAGVYSIQEALPGSPVCSLTTALLARLLELNELQRGRALAGQRDWHREAVDTVLFGGNDYCLHESLRQYSRATADLLQELQRLVSTHQNEPHRTNDIVHVDFQHANILVYNEQISGIIDWEEPYAGDCIFDVATLLFYAYDEPAIREQLWQYVLAHASLNLISVYLAHLMLRQVDWSLRHHDQPTSERYIVRAQTMLQDIKHML